MSSFTINPFTKQFWGKSNWDAAGNELGAQIDALTGKAQIDVEKANLQQQQDLLSFQKEQWDETKEREDTSQQRAVADLRAAGLSPILAAGRGAPTSSMPAMRAPQRGTSGLQKKQEFMLQAISAPAKIAMTVAELGAVTAQMEKTLAETSTITSMRPHKVEQLILNNNVVRTTMNSVISQAANKAAGTALDNELKSMINSMTSIEKSWLQAFDWWIHNSAPTYKTNIGREYTYMTQNPHVQKWIAAQTIINLRKTDLDLASMDVAAFENLGGAGGSVTKMISQLIGTILRGIIK